MRSALRIAPPAVKRAEGKTPFRCEGRRDMPECLDRRAMARPGSNFSLGRAGGKGGWAAGRKMYPKVLCIRPAGRFFAAPASRPAQRQRQMSRQRQLCCAERKRGPRAAVEAASGEDVEVSSSVICVGDGNCGVATAASARRKSPKRPKAPRR